MKKPIEVVHPIDAPLDSKKERPRGDLAYSIEEFCRRHNISRSTYSTLRDKGCGPREARVLSRVLITRESAEEWRMKISG
jgi:hypothetical protein